MKNTIFSENFTFIEFSASRYRYTDSRSGAPRHFLATMEEGSCRIVSEEWEIEVNAGEAFYIPMGLSYQSYWYGNDSIRFRSYGFDYFPGEVQFRLQKLPPEAYEAVRNIPLSDRPDAVALGAMYSVLGTLIPQMQKAETCRTERMVREAEKYMRADVTNSVTEIARLCGVSESTLYVAFRSARAMTPNEMRQQIAVEMAVKLLITTEKSVQQISDKLGFSSTDYFRRILRKHTGKTPRQIRSGAYSI